MFGFKVVTQYEQGIVFRFGRALPWSSWTGADLG
jgi:hypothetical protein